MTTTKLNHDRTNPREVYAEMQKYFPGSAKEWKTEMIAAFIPEGADTTHWQKVLRNTEYNINNPKPKARKRQRSAGKAPKGHNPGRLVISKDLAPH